MLLNPCDPETHSIQFFRSRVAGRRINSIHVPFHPVRASENRLPHVDAGRRMGAPVSVRVRESSVRSVPSSTASFAPN